MCLWLFETSICNYRLYLNTIVTWYFKSDKTYTFRQITELLNNALLRIQVTHRSTVNMETLQVVAKAFRKTSKSRSQTVCECGSDYHTSMAERRGRGAHYLSLMLDQTLFHSSRQSHSIHSSSIYPLCYHFISVCHFSTRFVYFTDEANFFFV